MDFDFEKALREVREDDYVPGRVSGEPVKERDGAIQNSGFEIRGRVVEVPHLTEEELGRNTPARGKKMVPVRVPAGEQSEFFYTLLSNAYALYVTEGSYDTDRLVKRTGIAEGTVARLIVTPEFKRAMRVRGVVPSASGLTAEQDYVIQKLVDPSDGKNLQAKLKQMGIPYSKYMAWMKQPVFKSIMDSHTNFLLQDNNASLVQLARKAGEGDLAAIRYMHELNGTYDPNRQTAIDFMQTLGLVVEIIFKHVKDPKVLEAINQDVNGLVEKISSPKQIGA